MEKGEKEEEGRMGQRDEEGRKGGKREWRGEMRDGGGRNEGGEGGGGGERWGKIKKRGEEKFVEKEGAGKNGRK